MKTKAIMNWSGGKDSSLALHKTRQDQSIEIVALLTTLNKQYARVSMHGTTETLLDAQAKAINLPLIKIYIPEDATMQSYEAAMSKAMNDLKTQGVTLSIFGDIFLQDLKQYRINKLKEIGFDAHFPLWKTDTTTLAQQFVQDDFKGITTCVNAQSLGKNYIGREMNSDFFSSLPSNVDPCGENGEYHSFVYAGPHMQSPLTIKKGDTVYREYKSPEKSDSNEPNLQMGFYYCDLLLD
ncbi:adenine nucleotide alpha hydrolase [Planctomycetota bacterium]|nr:adenine nucleotide alpha hydrolase [Planctomycetota bacterium]